MTAVSAWQYTHAQFIPPLTIKGYVIGSEDGSALGGTHIFARKTRRGFICNSKGFFEIQVLHGDTLIFSHIGYESHRFAVPESARNSLEIIVRMEIKPIELPGMTFEAKDDIAYLKKSPIEQRASPWYVHKRDSGEVDVPVGSTDYGPLSRFSREAKEKRRLQRLYEAEQRDRIYSETVSSDSVRLVFMDRYGLSRGEFDRFIVYFNGLSLPINRQNRKAIVEAMHEIFLQYILRQPG